jgi:citrate synthase
MLIFVNVRLPPVLDVYDSGVTRLTTEQAARRLGIKPATLYAYVSRGIVQSAPSKDGRKRTFSARDIEKLAKRGRPRQASRSHALDFAIDTSVTSITQHKLMYRGRDAVELATSATFEQVAGLLMEGTLRQHSEWPAREIEVPKFLGVFDHVAMVAILAGSSDPLRNDLSPGSVAQVARSLISAVVGSLPTLGDGRTPRLTVGDDTYRSTIAGRLWPRLSARRPSPKMVEVLNAALVLLADHELAVSTVAARVTASTRADPYAVIGAAVAAMSGPLHGGVVRPATRMLEQALASTERGEGRVGTERSASEALETFGSYPGFGHLVYKSGDPRAEALLGLLRRVAGGSKEMSVVDGLISSVALRRDVLPNIDFALAAFGLVAGFPEHAGQVIFSLARIAGWAAHAIEEYGELPLRYRARAVYAGDISVAGFPTTD